MLTESSISTLPEQSIFVLVYYEHMKGTLLTTIGLIGTVWGFLAPISMMNATTLDWIIYGVVFASFMVLAAIGMNIRTKELTANRNKTNHQ